MSFAVGDKVVVACTDALKNQLHFDGKIVERVIDVPDVWRVDIGGLVFSVVEKDLAPRG